MLTYKKKLTSYAAHARFLAECSEQEAGEVSRETLKAHGIRTPYAYSPAVTAYDWRGTPVVICETSHRVYEVWIVDRAALQPFGTADAI